ncbi:hypothetical protein C2845_PM01G10920 [Panicum miliaceum]|uniref:Xylanase inhibitor N-terminal domain-containing protein n=1 Tax=Panicum miliaceum TaxID=4540 RepID=A0A3L6TT95_PANMI|nr:hypothetical protein C2845_PM01G10920 [Panicum miliaceum]
MQSSNHRAAVLAALALLIAPPLMLFAVASGCDRHSRPLPVVTRVTRDDASGLYLISVRNYDFAPLVLDLAGPIIWWPCFWDHHTVPCSSSLCRLANRNHPPNCPYAGSGGPGSTEPNCNCTAYPYNPVDGQCSHGDLTWEWLSANTTDGQPAVPGVVPRRRVVRAVRLPHAVAAPALREAEHAVAAELKVASKFSLCLPSVAILGGGPVHIPGSDADVDPVSDHLSCTRLLRNPKNSAYYIDVRGIAVNGAQVPLPDHALALDAGQGQGGVALSTVTPYTALRSDIYRAVLKAFDAATAGIPRAEAPSKPFELCYNMTEMNLSGKSNAGVVTASIDIELDVPRPRRDEGGCPADAVLCLRGDGTRSGVRGA